MSRTRKEWIEDVSVRTSVRRGKLAFGSAAKGLVASRQYALRARVNEGGRPVEFTSKPFKSEDLVEGRFSEAVKWRAEKFWDVHTPQNVCEVQVSLIDETGKILDAAAPTRFGCRELWIDGRD